MSNTRKIKAKKPRVQKTAIKVKKHESALHTSFNIFSQGGSNYTVHSQKPMTLAEAQYYYHALAISAND